LYSGVTNTNASEAMDFELTEEQKLIRDTARDFAAREIAPRPPSSTRPGAGRREIVKRKMAELGLLGVAIPQEHGGAGMDTLSYALAMEEVSALRELRRHHERQQLALLRPVYKFGTDEQKKRVLTPCAAAKKLGCFGLTEPMSGSDAQTMVTGAEKTSGGWVLNGAKNWITNGPHADYILVFASPTERPEGQAHRVPRRRGRPATRRTPPTTSSASTPRTRAPCSSRTARCPDANVVGNVGEGFKVAMATLDGGRIGIACQAIGIARAALERRVAYAKERKSFGVPIAQHQAIQFMLADMATEIDAARLLTWRAATMKDEGRPPHDREREAKLYASEMATRVTHKAIQIHGGYGYSTEFPSSATTATRASPRSTRGRARSSASSSPRSDWTSDKVTGILAKNAGAFAGACKGGWRDLSRDDLRRARGPRSRGGRRYGRQERGRDGRLRGGCSREATRAAVAGQLAREGLLRRSERSSPLPRHGPRARPEARGPSAERHDEALDARKRLEHRTLGAELVEGPVEDEQQPIDSRKRVRRERHLPSSLDMPHGLALATRSDTHDRREAHRPRRARP
jgi:butyryl-CoA dehydrogenase